MAGYPCCVIRCKICTDGKLPDWIDFTIAGFTDNVQPAYTGECVTLDCATGAEYWFPADCYDEMTEEWDEECVHDARDAIAACVCAGVTNLACTVFSPCSSLNGTFRLYPDIGHVIFPEWEASLPLFEGSCDYIYAGEFDFGDILSPLGSLQYCEFLQESLAWGFYAIDATDEDNWKRNVKFRIGILLSKDGETGIAVITSTPIGFDHPAGLDNFDTTNTWLCTDCEIVEDRGTVTSGTTISLHDLYNVDGVCVSPSCGLKADFDVQPSISEFLEELPPFVEYNNHPCLDCGTEATQTITVSIQAGCDRSTPEEL